MLTTDEVIQPGKYKLVLEGTEPPPTGDCDCDVKAGTTTTLSPGSQATAAIRKVDKTHFLDLGIPQGLQGIPGTGGGGGALPRGYIVANGVADGVADDTNALQAAINAAIAIDGDLIIPAPQAGKFYKITNTLVFGNPNDNQYWLNVIASGHIDKQIVYMGPSGKPATKWYGMKGGSIRNMRVRVAPGITNAPCYEVLTEGNANSTASFTFYDCAASLGNGANNKGWRLGITRGGNGDVSQVMWVNPMVWGGGGAIGSSIAGQNGFEINDGNTCQLTWVGGGAALLDHAFHFNQASGMYIYGFGGSNNNIDVWSQYPTTLTFAGNRWESGKQHIVWGPGGHATIKVINSLISNYHPPTGRLFEFNGNCSVDLDAVKVEQADFDARMIWLGGSGKSSLIVDGGAYQCNAGSFYTIQNPGAWQVSARNVGKLTPGTFQVNGFFPNS